MSLSLDSKPFDQSGQAFWLIVAAVAGVVGGIAAGSGVGIEQLLLGIALGAASLLVMWRYRFGFVLMLLAMPLDIYGRIITSPVTITTFHVALLLTLLSFALHLVRTGQRISFSLVDIAMGALLLAALISLPDSLNPSETVVAFIRLAFLWLFVLVWVNGLTTQKVADRMTALLVATGVGTAAIALAQYFIPDFEFGYVRTINLGGGQLMRRAGAFFWDPNYMAAFLSITFLIAVAMLIHARRWRPAVVWAGASAVLGAGVLVTFSRTGWVGVAAGIVVLLLTAPARRRMPLMLATAAIAFTAVLANPGLVLDRVGSITDVGSDNSLATRYHMIPSTVEMIRDNWALGTGLGAYDVAYPEYRRLETLTFITKPHQLPLAIWAEMGVAGLVAQVLLVGSLIAVFWRRRPGGWTAMESFAAANLVSIVLIQSWFQYYLYFTYLWLVVAFAVAANRLARSDAKEITHER